MYTTAYKIGKISILLFIFLLAVLGNLLVCVSIWRFRRLRTLPYRYLLNLTAVDILIALTTMPTVVYMTITENWALGHVSCQISGFMITSLFMCAITTHVAIAYNRFVVISKSYSVRQVFTRRRTVASIIVLWVFSLGVSAPPLLGWGAYIEGRNFCTVDAKASTSYTIFLSLCAFALPLMLLIGMYGCISLHLIQNARKMEARRTAASMSRPNSSPPPPTMNSADSAANVSRVTAVVDQVQPCDRNEEGACHILAGLTREHSSRCDSNEVGPLTRKGAARLEGENPLSMSYELRVTRMLFVVVVLFLVCWTPLFVAGILYYNSDPAAQDYSAIEVGVLAACLATALDPTVYVTMCKQFRHALRALFCGRSSETNSLDHS